MPYTVNLQPSETAKKDREAFDFQDSMRDIIKEITEDCKSDGEIIARLVIEYAAIRVSLREQMQYSHKVLKDVTDHNQAQYENIKQLFRQSISSYDYHYDEEENRFVPDRWDSAQQRVALLNAIDPLAYQAVYSEKNKEWMKERNEALKARAEKQKEEAEKVTEKGQADENTTSPKE